MNDMLNPEREGMTLAQRQECGLDCRACIRDFEQTQQQVEILRLALINEGTDNQQLWARLRDAMRQTIVDLPPASRSSGLPGENADFRAGWDACREEVRARVEALLKAL